MKISECDSDTIRHHIGNPVFAIETSMLSIDRRTKDNAEVQQILDSVHSSLEKIKKFLDELED